MGSDDDRSMAFVLSANETAHVDETEHSEPGRKRKDKIGAMEFCETVSTPEKYLSSVRVGETCGGPREQCATDLEAMVQGFFYVRRPFLPNDGYRCIFCLAFMRRGVVVRVRGSRPILPVPRLVQLCRVANKKAQHDGFATRH